MAMRCLRCWSLGACCGSGSSTVAPMAAPMVMKYRENSTSYMVLYGFIWFSICLMFFKRFYMFYMVELSMVEL
jgi:hypothetical protein